MRKTASLLALALVVVLALASCSSGGSPNSTAVPSAGAPSTTVQAASQTRSVPSSVTAVPGYRVSIFATLPNGSTKPDSLAQVGKDVFVGFGDTVGPDGTPGPGGKSSVEIVAYDQNGKVDRTYTVPGHNDGLMAFDNETLWAMSNEDANAILTIIDTKSGNQQTYTPQPSLVNSTGGLPHGGGLDDMQLINGKVYVSASNPTASSTGTCPPNSSTPGCPNGINTGPFVYVLTLNGDGKTFNLTPVASSEIAATNVVTGAAGTINITDPDSEVVSPDGSTLIVDGQADAELAFVRNFLATPAVSYLPLTLNGSPQQVDDTRFVPHQASFLLLTDTPSNTIYRIDGDFEAGDAYSSGQTALLKLNTSSGTLTPVVSGFGAPHGLLFFQPGS